MQKTIHCIILTIFLPAAFTACKKNVHDASFKAQARLQVGGVEAEGARKDSIGFTFAIWPTTLADTVVTVVVQTMGNVADKDRSFTLVADSGTTALPAEYELPSNLVIPANSFKVMFPVRIKRSDRLKNEIVKLVLRVQPNEHFLPGPVLAGTADLGPAFRIVWTEVLTQPAVWNNSMLYAVGRWSRVKHQAIIDVTGIRNYDGLNYSQTYAIAAVMLDWLNAYNTAHPGAPLLDEKGQEVRICSQCN
ncbi:DUF4843 domain-containing protein [Pseudoflavitalea sp. X16]|uniref:DUF4843 domain-containing protein n=1 Tax=Paraflavitalea devenefica TaxID=2716334 RepID=UPI00141DD516|nr:DUF4843 domain-containing protein [Paraflavitalea devenefica]NII29068.1 DUF4843 domain-containing protein [Paraflavitalea devenefica]